MRNNFIFIVFLSCLFSHGQSQFDFAKVDSIHKNISNFKIVDSTKLAVAYFSLGEEFRHNFQTDSAYYYYNKAEKISRKRNIKLLLAKTLYGISAIQSDEKDYTGAEVTSFKAMSILETFTNVIEADRYKSYIYNNLGIGFNELKQFDESIKYHKKSLELRKKLNNKTGIDNSLNNMGTVYRDFQYYDLALNNFNQILDNKNLINERPDFYALVLDNYANTLYELGNHEELPDLYLKALSVIDSFQTNHYNSIIINQHLAEYYQNSNQKDSALYYAYKAKNLSEEYYNDDLLKSLKLLSEIEEGETSAKFLSDYIKLSDSLLRLERATRDKYARIRFETNQIEQENIEIAKERMWLFIISIVIAIASLLLYIIINQRNKNKELKFIQQQQETNEEIYNLMLSQNESIEEARAIEKQRISGELHDGVLGRLFGTRLSLDSLNMSNTEEAIKTRSQYIAELKTIEEDIRKVSHELNTDFISGSGFIDIIKTLVETQTNVYELDYELDYQDVINWEAISNRTKIHIYRIVQESLHNIHKHAKATKVNINFELENDKICLTLSDNGSGFNVNKAKSGIGLKNMNSRINEINGTINITSEKDVGTTVTIVAPID